MLPATSRDAFLASPVGFYLTGPFYFYWCASEELYGVSVWGAPEARELEGFLEVIAVEQRPHARPHATIIDFRYLQTVEAGFFDGLTAFIVRSAPRLQAVLSAQALVRPPGLLGDLLISYYQRLAPPYEVRVFSGLEQALAPFAEAEDATLCQHICELERHARTGGDVLLNLRRILSLARHDVSLEQAARAMGMSTRTLQRHLQHLGTSFIEELRRARLELAKSLLRTTDLKLTSIAFEAGFSSAQQFCAVFRRSEGCSPSAFRRR